MTAWLRVAVNVALGLTLGATGAGACSGGWPPGPRHVQAPTDRGGRRGPWDQAVVAVPRFDASTNAASSS